MTGSLYRREYAGCGCIAVNTGMSVARSKLRPGIGAITRGCGRENGCRIFAILC